MKFKKSILATVVAGLAISSVAAFACPGPEDRGGKGEYRHHSKESRYHEGSFHESHFWLGKISEKLDLSDEQKGEIKDVLNQAKDEARPLRETLRDSRKAEREAADAGAKASELKKLAHKTADARVELMLHGKTVEGRVRSVLTDDQQAQLDQLKATRRAHMEARAERWKEKREAADKP